MKLISTLLVAASAVDRFDFGYDRPAKNTQNNKDYYDYYDYFYDYEIENLPQKGECSGLMYGETTCPIGTLCLDFEHGFDGFSWTEHQGCVPCASPWFGWTSADKCAMWYGDEYGVYMYTTNNGQITVDLKRLCEEQCHGEPHIYVNNPELPHVDCSSSTDCRDALGDWMCNFDYVDSGFCEPCNHHYDYDACINSTFSTQQGTDECFKVCVDGNYDESSCDVSFENMHDFLDNAGASLFEEVFTNEQDSFSRKPGKETHGLKRRKIQFTQWIDNIFSKMDIHMEKRRFVKCFEETGKVIGGQISSDFDQCSLLGATTVDEYFEGAINFVNWLYSDCGDATKMAGKLEQRWNRVNEIKSEIQAYVNNKDRDFFTFSFTEYYSQWGDYPYSTWINWTPMMNNPPQDGELYTFTNNCIDGNSDYTFFTEWYSYDYYMYMYEGHHDYDGHHEGLKCNQLSEYHCFGLYPEDHIYFNQKDEHGDLLTVLNCVECGCQHGVGPLVPLEQGMNGAPDGWTPVNKANKIKNPEFEEWRTRKRKFEN